jgi:D-3-phosphoglycerate dehydrogenase / 2-oxoglutarate reductase
MLSQNIKEAAAKAASVAQDIIPRSNKVTRSVSNSWTANLPQAFSTSPTFTFHSPPKTGAPLTRVKTLKPFATQDIKVLLLENVNKTGQDLLNEQGYQVEVLKTSLAEDELIEKIKYVNLPKFACIFLTDITEEMST